MTPIAIKKLIVNKNMKHYNFDEVIERHGTSCVKFDRLKEMFGNENLIPLWVADMDFRTEKVQAFDGCVNQNDV